MPRINKLIIKNYRSIGEQIEIKFPQNQPVILIGENNSGKTNIIRALDIMFGEWHPKYKDLEDHDFYNRNPENEIIIETKVSGLSNRLGRNNEYECTGFKLTGKKGGNNEYVAIQEDGDENPYVSNELREELCAVMISSEHNLRYQLSYTSKYTLLSRVTRAFHDRLISNTDRVSRLKDLYTQIIEIFNEVPGFIEFKENMSSLTGELIQNLTHGLQLDFSAYDPSNYFKNLRVLPHENDEARNFDELGTGQQQILALSFAHAYAKYFRSERGLILAIDEPETYLHPLAQKWLARTLFQMAEDGLQIVIATHSSYFIDLKYLEGIYLVRKGNNGTYVINSSKQKFTEYCRSKGALRANEDTIIPFYSKCATPHILKGLFAKKVALVEGPTEEIALPIYFEKVRLDVLKEGIDIIGVGGKGELAKWWRFFTHYSIPCFVCFDNDTNDDEDGRKRKDALKAIGIQDEEIENLISTENWNIGDKFCIFGRDFETTLRSSFPNYENLENETKNILGDSKPIVAREVAVKLEYNETDVGWQKFIDLKDKLLNLDNS